MRRFLILMICLIPLAGFAANLENIPSEVVQPDGSVLKLLASGDEYANRLHDSQGFTIIQSPTDGYYYYAVLQSGEPAASQWRVGTVDPASLGIAANITVSPAARERKISFMNAHQQRNERGPNTGTVNNLNVFIRFSDQNEFDIPREQYDARFNATGDEAISLQNYFHKVSYNQLTYVTHLYPECSPQVNLSYQDSHPRSYYVPYNSVTNPTGYSGDDERTFREHTLLANAIASIASQVPASLNIDADNDGGVDNVCFIIRGPHTAWAELLWAHRWALYAADAFINGKQVWDFTFQPEDQNSVRTLCHEMFHSVGAPDLYHYTYNGVTPAGCWDIMESGNGHMGMYMKYKYGGWIPTIPSIPGAGTYTLNPSTSSTNNVYKLAIPGNSSQYLVFEYRKSGSDIFEAELPGSGLLIYRINQNQDGNAQGPPDEVYIFRPNGTSSVNGLIADAAFSADAWQTEFNAFTNPSSFLSNGLAFQVNINSISAAGETISFQVSEASAALPPVISSISPVSGSILANEDFIITVNASAPNSQITNVDFYLNDILVGSDQSAPFSLDVDASTLALGTLNVRVVAFSALGAQLSTTKNLHYKIIDPAQPNWFSWLSDSPLWTEFGRGAVPIKVAIDLDLGVQEYQVKGIRIGMCADAWGAPAIPGFLNAKINRFASGAITEQTLIQLGDIIIPDYDPEYVFTIVDTTHISGQIAVILDIFDYQNMRFDALAPCGHSWLTEPNRTWTDALARGVQGAAAIELLLQAPSGVAIQDELSPPLHPQLANYPNPFTQSTTINFSLSKSTDATLTIYNLKGQKVKTLLKGKLDSGKQLVSWNGKDEHDKQVAQGIYYYQLKTGKQIQTAKMLLLN